VRFQVPASVNLTDNLDNDNAFQPFKEETPIQFNKEKLWLNMKRKSKNGPWKKNTGVCLDMYLRMLYFYLPTPM
jgi:hypothetical protein